MIGPDVDLETSADQEIIDSYLEGGLVDEATARMYLAIVRSPRSDLFVD
ncbi:hypothetical protein [Leifsonia kafniensis]